MLTGWEISCIFLFMTIHPVIRELLDEIDAFRDLTGMSATAFGTEALNDSKFLSDLRAGRLPSVATMDKVRNFMRHSGKRKRENVSA